MILLLMIIFLLLQENLQHCYDLMQELALEGYGPGLTMALSSCTPANVLDFSSSVSGSQSNQMSETGNNASDIGGIRRQKIEGFVTNNSSQLSQTHQ